MKMKKRVLGLIVLSLVLCACSASKNTSSKGENPYKLIDTNAKSFSSNDGKATITASLLKVDDKNVVFTMSNTSDYEVNYGNIGKACLQIKTGEDWVDCAYRDDASLAVTDEALILEKGTSRENTYDYNYYYGKLKPGEYRLKFTDMFYVDSLNLSFETRGITILLEFVVE